MAAGPTLCLLRDWIWKTFKLTLMPELHHYVQQVEYLKSADMASQIGLAAIKPQKLRGRKAVTIVAAAEAAAARSRPAGRSVSFMPKPSVIQSPAGTLLEGSTPRHQVSPEDVHRAPLWLACLASPSSPSFDARRSFQKIVLAPFFLHCEADPAFVNVLNQDGDTLHRQRTTLKPPSQDAVHGGSSRCNNKSLSRSMSSAHTRRGHSGSSNSNLDPHNSLTRESSACTNKHADSHQGA
ncbi:phospholipid-translocating p-type flippase subfamily protein [Cyclospora cayetanensis]|uniref:Phospholipid-translocating p-type flippase subfamily protein n=1 Tax=Cyclospora cayetanensis TaxID=88456 RepID=A0A1D3D3J1_9EIME|nr:phospholipid-translocating p-type flippase subfamily protein [Cyclospora cayetanensis]